MSSAPTLAGVLAAVRPLIEAGAAIHWLVPGQKNPLEEKWASAPRYTEAQLKASHRTDANVGIRLGEPSRIGDLYLHLVDLDIRKAECADEAWSALHELWPGARTFPSVASGSGGASRHLYFLTDKPFRKKKLRKSHGFSMVWDDRKQRDVRKNDWEIDLLGTGSQAVLPPSIHPDTKLPYRWECPLDLDFPLLMEVGASLVESWGADTASEHVEDEEDLLSLVRQAPMDLDEDEIDDILSNLPADWVDDRDQWLTVGAALHHQYEGTAAGFERWNEWAKASPKFDARDSARVWKSFKGSSNPVRMATLIQAVQAQRLSEELDLEADDGFGPPAVLPQGDLSDLLGDEPPAQPRPKEQPLDEPPADWQQLLHRNEEGELKSTLPNVQLIVQNDRRTFGITAFNEFTNEIVLRREPLRVKKRRDSAKPVFNLEGRLWEVTDPLNGNLWTDSHDIGVRAVIEAKPTLGGYGIKVTDRDLRGSVDASAQKHRFHPVREHLLSAEWDGTPRVDRLFINYLGCADTPYHRAAARLTLLGAVTRVFEPGSKFDFVPILEGVQGKGKSTFIKTLGLHWYNELTGDVSDPKQMVEVMQGSWILEIGELSSMARAEVNDLKAFVSRTTDKVRLSYERRSREYPRQCIFFGSTNDREYLRDQTGGRRFWPIVCNIDGQIDNQRLAREVMQVWAEAVQMYRDARKRVTFGDLPLFMNEEAAAQEALEMQESRRVETAEEMLAGKIVAWLDQPIGADNEFDDLDQEAPKVYRQETCVAQIWEEMMGREGSIPHVESIKIGKALQLVGWPRTTAVCRGKQINRKYGPCRVYERP